MRKLRQTKAGANETLGQVTQRRDESEGRTPVSPVQDIEFFRELTRFNEYRCGGGRRVIRQKIKGE